MSSNLYSNFNDFNQSNMLISLIQPNSISHHLYDSKQIPVSIQTDIIKSYPDFYLCVSLESQIDKTNCVQRKYDLLLSLSTSGTLDIYISITQSDYSLLYSTTATIDIFNNDTNENNNQLFNQFMILDQKYSDSQFQKQHQIKETVIHTNNNKYYYINVLFQVYNVASNTLNWLWLDTHQNTTSNVKTDDNINNTHDDGDDDDNNDVHNDGDDDDNNHDHNDNDDGNNNVRNNDDNDEDNDGDNNNIMLFFKDLGSHSSNDRFVYWACHQHSLHSSNNNHNHASNSSNNTNNTNNSNNNSNNNRNNSNNSNNSSSRSKSGRITHIITGDDIANINSTTSSSSSSSSIYVALNQCGIIVLHYSCLSAKLADVCLSHLPSYSSSHQTYDATSSSSSNYNNSRSSNSSSNNSSSSSNNKNSSSSSSSSSNNNNFDNNTSSNIESTIRISDNSDNNGSSDDDDDDEFLSICKSCFHSIIQSFLLTHTKVLLYMNTHGDHMTHLLLHLIRTQLPAILLGVDLPNIHLPHEWSNCCVDFIIAPSKYVALHSAVWTLGKPVLAVYPPLHPDFVPYADWLSLSYDDDDDGNIDNSSNSNSNNNNNNANNSSNSNSSNNSKNNNNIINSSNNNNNNNSECVSMNEQINSKTTHNMNTIINDDDTVGIENTCLMNGIKNVKNQMNDDNDDDDNNNNNNDNNNDDNYNTDGNNNDDNNNDNDDDEDPYVFIYVGRLSLEKSPGLLLRALALIITSTTTPAITTPSITMTAAAADVDDVDDSDADHSATHMNNTQRSSSSSSSSSSTSSSFSNSSTSSSSSSSSSFLMSLSKSQRERFQKTVKVHFYGDGPLKSSLLHLAQRLGLAHYNNINSNNSNSHVSDRGNILNNNNSHVSDRGNILINPNMVCFYPAEFNRSNVAAIMSAADVLVNPIVMGETFGFIHIEAAAVGTPVLAFNRGANRETVSSGLLIEEVSVTALAEMMYSIFIASTSETSDDKMDGINRSHSADSSSGGRSGGSCSSSGGGDSSSGGSGSSGGSSSSSGGSDSSSGDSSSSDGSTSNSSDGSTASFSSNNHHKYICMNTKSSECLHHLRKQSHDVVTRLNVLRHTQNLFEGISIILNQRQSIK